MGIDDSIISGEDCRVGWCVWGYNVDEGPFFLLWKLRQILLLTDQLFGFLVLAHRCYLCVSEQLDLMFPLSGPIVMNILS